MSNCYKVFSMMLLGMTIVSGASVIKVPSSFAADEQKSDDESFDAMVARVEAQYKSNQTLQSESAASIKQVETEYKAELTEAEKIRTPTMEEKLAAAKAKGKSVDDMLKNEDGEVLEVTDDVDLFESTSDEAVSKENSTAKSIEAPASVTKQKTTADYLKERNPQYTAPKTPASKPTVLPAGNQPAKGRRPFIRSQIDNSGQQTVFAGSHYSDNYSFAAEEPAGDESSTDTPLDSYSGYNDADKYIFPSDIAAFCQINAQDIVTDGKMQECLKKIMVFKARPGQSAKDEARDLYEGSVKENTINAISSAAQSKNVAANYEKEVLIPIQTQSSESTTERSDFQTLTMATLESVKSANRLIDIYATTVGMQALKDFGTFEVEGQELTQLKEEVEDTKKEETKTEEDKS